MLSTLLQFFNPRAYLVLTLALIASWACADIPNVTHGTHVTTTGGKRGTLVIVAADTTSIEEPEDEVAVARFRAAELYLFRFDDAKRARDYYESVIEHHPESSLAPKAALAIAWILETRWDDFEAARAAYESILVDYPDSDFAAAAAEGLERLGGAGSD